MKTRLELADSSAENKRELAEEDKCKKSDETANSIEKGPAAFETHRSKGWVLSALTMREIQANAFKYIAGYVNEEGLTKVVRKLVALIRKYPANLGQSRHRCNGRYQDQTLEPKMQGGDPWACC